METTKTTTMKTIKPKTTTKTTKMKTIKPKTTTTKDNKRQ